MNEIYHKIGLNLAYTRYRNIDPINPLTGMYIETGRYVEGARKLCWRIINIEDIVW